MRASKSKVRAQKRERSEKVSSRSEVSEKQEVPTPSLSQPLPSPAPLDRDELLKACPVFRVMNGAAIAGKSLTLLRRGDIVEVLKCKFGVKELGKAIFYFENYFTSSLTKLRFQAWISARQELKTDSGSPRGDAVTVFAQNVLKKNSATLKVCDLSRNRFTGDDVPLLLGPQGLNISVLSNIEVLDLSYNPIGNAGARAVFEAIASNASIRAVILKHCNIDDAGAHIIGNFLRSRRRPEHNESQKATAFYLRDEIKLMFFVNLNENRIGASGTRDVSFRIPDFVSVTVVKQQPALSSSMPE